MKVQVEKEASEDKASYDKYMCWCKTNEEEKTDAISSAEKTIDQLTALIEELVAKEGQLKTEISGLAKDIADDQDALATATATREKEYTAFLAEESDLKETLALLKEAVSVLSSVQLLQKQGKPSLRQESNARSILLQFLDKIRTSLPKFQNVMQKDLFDVLGSLDGFSHQKRNDEGFLPRRSAALVEQKGGLLPWEKTDEQVGMESKSTDLTGAAADAKSYNSRTGRILGLLREMSEETARDLSEAQKEDSNANVTFQNLRAAKLGEISSATQQKKRKEGELAYTLDKAATSKEDKLATSGALEADQEFLANLLKDCKTEDEEYKQRFKTRSQELVALSEVLKILSEDNARDLFGKTVSLLQLSRTNANTSLVERVAAQDRAAERAMQRIATVARKHKNWALVSLAVRVRLDAFSKVKEVMDKMLVELAKQQKEEYAKWESCKSNIDTTEDSIKVGEQTKEDLDEKHKQLVNMLESLDREISELKSEERDMKISLKDAGEHRKAQNEFYQASVMDQRATTNILNKALARLKQFYATKFVQVHAHRGEQQRQPGRAVAPPPPKPRDYSKSGGAGGVIQLLMKIIANSEVAEQELNMGEQRSQALYADFVKATTTTIEADRAAISEKSTRISELKSEKSETEESQLSNDEALNKFLELLKAQHLDCDYLLKYFDVRQQARAEEMDAITDAKAVLSGASFGK